uniref:Uncharacterized protein n=1 Tax=viral metagenome TaxID=1070528 RepID=A0A6H1Z7I7_9ZZZZ
MPTIIAMGALAVAALFGGAAVLDKIDDLQDDSPQMGLINIGSLTMIVIGGLAVWYLTKKKR